MLSDCGPSCLQGTQQLLWPPLPALRVLCVGSSGAGHQPRLHASQLHAFYSQVRLPELCCDSGVAAP
jgi:hypothetical protein